MTAEEKIRELLQWRENVPEGRLVNPGLPPFDLLGFIKPSFSKNLIRDIDIDGKSFFINLDASPIFISFQPL